jgi:hypothetical protein
MHSCTALAGPLRLLSYPTVPTAGASVLDRARGPRRASSRVSEQAMKRTWTGRLHAFIVQPKVAAASAPRSVAWARRAWRKTMVRWSSRLSKSSVERRPADFDRAFASLPLLFLHGTSHTVPASHPPMTPLAALPPAPAYCGFAVVDKRSSACLSVSASASASASPSSSPSSSPSASAPAPPLPLLPHSPAPVPACT